MIALRDRLGAFWRHGGPGVSSLAAQMKAAAPSGGPDRLFCGVVLALTGFGIAMVFSAGAAFAAKTYGDWTYFLKREAIYAVLGLGAFVLALRTDYSFYRRITYPLLFASLGLLVLVRMIGPTVNGAVRWFRLGPISFQPSELAKFALVLYLAMLLARKADKVRQFSIGFLPPLLMTGMFLGLILIQPDLGTSFIIGLAALALLFVAGTRTSYILLAVLAAVPVGWKVLIAGEPWRVRRLMAFLNPWEFRQKAGYQLFESMISIGSGGLTGLGLGDGRQKLLFLPEAHTDFILSIVGEELGFLGLGAVVLAFVLLVWRGLRAAMRARDAFGCYLAFGISVIFALQAAVNMGVVLGLLPTKGLPLPFVSYGGTSLVVCLFMAGVVANISTQNPQPASATPGTWFRGRAPRAKNRRAEPGARVVVASGRYPRPSAPG